MIKSKLSELIALMKKDKRVKYGIYGGGVLVIVAVIILIASLCNKEDKGEENSKTVSGNVGASSELDTQLDIESDPEIVEFVNKYFDALISGDVTIIESLKSYNEEGDLLKLAKRAQYYESYSNLTIYSKPGLDADSKIIFVYYDIKFVDIDTLTPGFKTLYIARNDEGNYEIISGEVSDEVKNYAMEMSTADDVTDLINKVQVKYNEALANDVNLSLFMEQLPELIQAQIDAEQAAQAEQEAVVEENPSVEVVAQPTTVETVKALDTVNIRVSDSTNSDVLGKLQTGTTASRLETKENGWSRISYDGQEGYIKSEFLEVVANETEEPEETVEQTTDTSTAEATGKITIKESVRIRASASTNGDKIATAYKGESYDLIMEQADGWCKINYNGQTAYVNTDFVTID